MALPLANYRNVSPSVVKATGDVIHVHRHDLKDVIALAKSAPNKRGRILLHPDQTDTLHEMIIAIPSDSFDHPHINYKSGKSFLALSGTFSVVTFSDDGQEFAHHIISATDKTSGVMVRLQKAVWHSILPIEGDVVFLESILGPFEGNDFAKWFPDEEGAARKAFIDRVKAGLNTTQAGENHGA